MIDPAVIHFFSDEIQKEAGLASEVGGHLGGAARWAGGHLGGAAKWVGQGIVDAPGEVRKSVAQMATRPGQSLREGWHATPGWAKALTVGMTGLGAKDALTGPSENRGERIGRLVGGTFTGIAGTTATGGLLPGLVTGVAGDAIGGAIGRGVDRGVARLRGRPVPAAPPSPVQG